MNYLVGASKNRLIFITKKVVYSKNSLYFCSVNQNNDGEIAQLVRAHDS